MSVRRDTSLFPETCNGHWPYIVGICPVDVKGVWFAEFEREGPAVMCRMLVQHVLL